MVFFVFVHKVSILEEIGGEKFDGIIILIGIYCHTHTVTRSIHVSLFWVIMTKRISKATKYSKKYCIVYIV